MDEALKILVNQEHQQANRIPDNLQTFIGSQGLWDANLSSILGELGTDAKFYDAARIPEECVIYNNQDKGFVDHLTLLRRSKQNFKQEVNSSNHPFWLLEKEDGGGGGGGIVVELKSKHPYTVGCLEIQQKSDDEGLLKVVEHESSSRAPGPRHIEGFMDTSQEILKNQQVATNLIYSISVEAIAQFRILYQMDSGVFDMAGNGSMAIQLIQILLSCQDTLNKIQAFLDNTKDVVNSTLDSVKKTVCSTCFSPNHLNVYDIGVLVSLHQLKAQKETAKSLEQATKKVSSNSRQTSITTTTTAAMPRTHPLLDSVMMGLWMNPDQNHRKNSNAKTLVFTSASKDAHCYLKAAMEHLIAKQNYNNSNKRRKSKKSTTTTTTNTNTNITSITTTTNNNNNNTTSTTTTNYSFY